MGSGCVMLPRGLEVVVESGASNNPIVISDTPEPIMSPKVESMNAWKVGGELHCPKNMTKGS